MTTVTKPTPRAIMQAWRAAHWPPPGLRGIPDLPIYYGSHDQVMAFGEQLAAAMAGIADHITDKCRGRKPRWMAVPKVLFGVQRLNITRSTAKASRTFSTTTALTGKCGSFAAPAVDKMEAWLRTDPDAVLVAHKPFVDLRAYVFVSGEDAPRRERFFRNGLVMAVSPDFKVQDLRAAVRDRRSDALTSPLAENSKGWAVYGVLRPAGDAND